MGSRRKVARRKAGVLLCGRQRALEKLTPILSLRVKRPFGLMGSQGESPCPPKTAARHRTSRLLRVRRQARAYDLVATRICLDLLAVGRLLFIVGPGRE